MADFNTVETTDHSIEIVHPGTGEPIGLRVTLRPNTAPEVKAIEKKWMDSGLKNASKRVPLTAETVERRALDMLVALVGGWQWVEDAEGKPGSVNGEQPECTPVNVRKLLTDYPWLKKQIDQEAAVDSAFFKG